MDFSWVGNEATLPGGWEGCDVWWSRGIDHHVGLGGSGDDRFKALTKYGVGGDGFDPGVDPTKFSCQ